MKVTVKSIASAPPKRLAGMHKALADFATSLKIVNRKQIDLINENKRVPSLK